VQEAGALSWERPVRQPGSDKVASVPDETHSRNTMILPRSAHPELCGVVAEELVSVGPKVVRRAAVCGAAVVQAGDCGVLRNGHSQQRQGVDRGAGDGRHVDGEGEPHGRARDGILAGAARQGVAEAVEAQLGVGHLKGAQRVGGEVQLVARQDGLVLALGRTMQGFAGGSERTA
jgi:hypothetical protein